MINRQNIKDLTSPIPVSFAYNGMLKDDEIQGVGNSYTTEFRQYDARLGRWLSRDGKEDKYPGISTYNFSLNNPLIFVDPDGKDARYTVQKNENGGGLISIETTVHLYGKDASIDVADRANQSFSNLKNTATYTHSNTKEQWAVVINVKFVYDDKIKTEADVMGIPKGDNIMLIDFSLTQEELGVPNVIGVLGTSCIGCNKAKTITSSFSTLIHEVGHEIGFDERYNINKPLGTLVGDIMGAQGPIVNQIAPIHFEDVAKSILARTNNGTTNVEGVNTDRLDSPDFDPTKMTFSNAKQLSETKNVSDVRYKNPEEKTK